MAGSMSEADLLEDLKRSLHDAASVFNAAGDADFKRFLAVACTGMAEKRPRTLLGSVELQADQPVYPLTLPDLAAYKTHLWGGRPLKPWAPGYPGALPRVSLQSNNLVFDPAPTAAHLAAFGSTFRFWYFALHSTGTTEAETTLRPVDRPLLLLRAQAEAMRELSMRNINKPVAMRDGYSGTPRNSTPAALYAQLLDEWKAAQ